MNDDENFDYRTPASVAPAPRSSKSDKNDYSTLLAVQKILKDGIAGLYKDFNAFTLLKNKNNKEAVEALYRDIDGKQTAYDILTPIEGMIDSAVEDIRLELKEGIK